MFVQLFIYCLFYLFLDALKTGETFWKRTDMSPSRWPTKTRLHVSGLLNSEPTLICCCCCCWSFSHDHWASSFQMWSKSHKESSLSAAVSRLSARCRNSTAETKRNEAPLSNTLHIHFLKLPGDGDVLHVYSLTRGQTRCARSTSAMAVPPKWPDEGAQRAVCPTSALLVVTHHVPFRMNQQNIVSVYSGYHGNLIFHYYIKSITSTWSGSLDEPAELI